jgi:diacylglycerol O-acyltransferase
MNRSRLSAFDASFLSVETPSAHMHVGWVALLSAPPGGRTPSFAEIRDHIAARMSRAPRYRQKLAHVPLGLHAPEWVDDEEFSVERHVYRAPGPLRRLVDEVMSVPLRRERPLWEMWICEEPEQGAFAVVGKAHHCMIDGVAALELASLVLDVTPEAAPMEPDRWQATPAPGAERLLARGVRDLVGEQLGLLHGAVRAAAGSPTRAARDGLSGALSATRAVGRSLRSAPASMINRPLSPMRSLAWTQRPLSDLQLIKRSYDVTVNDVLLAAVAGGVRKYMIRHGEDPVALKAMVPVYVGDGQSAGSLGNSISFVFVDLPCDEVQPLARLYAVRARMDRIKRERGAEGADLLFKATARTPGGVQRAVSRFVASPRTFNLVVSNLAGPSTQLYLLGCPLNAIYPVIPLAEGHALSVGMLTVGEQACIGVYADRHAVADVDVVARDIDGAIVQLLACVNPGMTPPNWLKPVRITAQRLAPLAPRASAGNGARRSR